MSETETVEEKVEVEESEKAEEVEEVKEESQTEAFIFEDLGTKKYAQVHDYEIEDSCRVIPKKVDDTWEVLALSTKEKNLDRLDEALSSGGGYTLVTRKINVAKERAPLLIHEYKKTLETEFPEVDLLKRIDSMKKELEASKS
ncbi:unnamed protein product [marine sediment metagenome]|uniref:Uncharacterized protein n=1 Tax=marine sediment metagenome TaxID=412755 RepID=X1LNS1_9ZZZZ